MYWMYADGLNGDFGGGGWDDDREPTSFIKDRFFYHTQLPKWATLEDYSDKSYLVTISLKGYEGTFFLAKSLVRYSTREGKRYVHRKIFGEKIRELGGVI